MDVFALETWYLNNKRELSFRHTQDPYKIWISEIMLQQTQVDTVIPYYDRFVKRFSRVELLASADIDEVLKMVEGIGYYRRFRLMHRAAKMIVDKFNGIFPNSYDEVRKLPGIGAYTAGAIMSIAYGKPYSAVDGNVIRVLTRYLGDDRDMRKDTYKQSLDRINQSYIEKANPLIYTHAMMELGAIVCKKNNPLCEKCPLAEHCVAYHEGRQTEFPVLSKLSKPQEFQFITLVMQKDNHIVLRKRDEKLLEGMYAYPQYAYESIYALIDDLHDKGIYIEVDENKKMYKHVFSHQIWYMDVYHAHLISGTEDDWLMIAKDKIHDVPMAVAHRKII